MSPGARTSVPNVVGAQFDRALGALLDRRLLVSVRRFVPIRHALAEQGWGRLENYRWAPKPAR